MTGDLNAFGAISREKILAAAELIRSELPPSPLEKIGPVWAKFESDNPTGAFKVRGGLVYFDWLTAAHPQVNAAIAATRGNHGQSVAFAAKKAGLACKLVVPTGNSPAKNQAMRELGAEIVEHGRDFAESLEFAQTEAKTTGAHFVPSFDWKLVLGVSTCGYELFSAAPDLDAVFVPIGLGSGICGTIAARNALGLTTPQIIGVVAQNAPAYAESFAAGRVMESKQIPKTIADGVACRIPNADSFAVIREHAASVVTVAESEIETAIREIYEKTGRRIEGAGAIAYAAWKQHGQNYRNPAVIVSGGNIDDDVFQRLTV